MSRAPARRVAALGAGTALVLAAACARIEAPPGGPVDKTPPYVAAVYPAPGAVSVPRDPAPEIRFSEWVDPAAKRGRVLVSPPGSSPPRVTVKGERLRLEFAEALDSATTYRVQVSGELRDLQGNDLGEPFHLVFSTGPALDSGALAGRILSDGPAAPALVALYPLDRKAARPLGETWNLPTQEGGGQPLGDTAANRQAAPAAPDLPDPLQERPRQLAWTDAAGLFSLQNGQTGGFAVLAFTDRDGDQKPDPGLETVAVGPLAAFLRPQGSRQSLRLFASDTAAPRLLEAAFVPARRLDSGIVGLARLRFAPALNPAEARRAATGWAKPDSGDALALNFAGGRFAYDPGGEVWELELPALPLGKVRLELSGWMSRQGMACADSACAGEVEVEVVAPPDTGTWGLQAQGPLSSDGLPQVSARQGWYREGGWNFRTTRPLAAGIADSLDQRLEGRIDTLPTAVEWSRVGPSEVHIRPKEALPEGKGLRLQLKPVPGDTVSKPRVLADLPAPPPGGLRVERPEAWKEAVVVARQGEREFVFGGKGRPVAEWRGLPAGQYKLDAYLDRNGNGQWDPGGLRPWTPQEPWVRLSDSLAVGDSLRAFEDVTAWPE